MNCRLKLMDETLKHWGCPCDRLRPIRPNCGRSNDSLRRQTDCQYCYSRWIRPPSPSTCSTKPRRMSPYWLGFRWILPLPRQRLQRPPQLARSCRPNNCDAAGRPSTDSHFRHPHHLQPNWDSPRGDGTEGFDGDDET